MGDRVVMNNSTQHHWMSSKLWLWLDNTRTVRVQFHTKETRHFCCSSCHNHSHSYAAASVHTGNTETPLTRVSFAKNLDGRGHFLLTDSLVLLSLGRSLEALPGQGAQVEVHQHIAERLQVVTSGLLCRQKREIKYIRGSEKRITSPVQWQSTTHLDSIYRLTK